jgi:hypothetical protein
MSGNTSADQVVAGTAPASTIATEFAEGVAGARGDFLNVEIPGVVNVPEGQPAGTATGRVIPEDEHWKAVEKARQQEREKLHRRLEEMEQSISGVTAVQQQLEEAKAREAEAQRQAEEAARLAEMSALERITEVEANLQRRLEEEREARLRAEALIAKEREFQELQDYKAQQIAQNAADIAPQFLDYIGGNTAEEIAASIDRARQKTAEILNEVEALRTQQWHGMRGPSVTAPGGLGPAENETGMVRQLSDQEISAMSMEEYARHRGPLRQAAAQAYYGRGR